MKVYKRESFLRIAIILPKCVLRFCRVHFCVQKIRVVDALSRILGLVRFGSQFWLDLVLVREVANQALE